MFLDGGRVKHRKFKTEGEAGAWVAVFKDKLSRTGIASLVMSPHSVQGNTGWELKR